MRDLLVFHGSFLSRQVGRAQGDASESKPMEDKKRKWREYSEAIVVRLEMGPKYAQLLCCWEREWFETRMAPRCPIRGRNVKRLSLFNDEGVCSLSTLLVVLLLIENLEDCPCCLRIPRYRPLESESSGCL